MYKQAQFGLLLILISIDLILSLTAPNNVCKTFEGYYTNKDCYYNADQISEVPDIVKRHNYSLEEYEVTTTDGYILKIFRIPNGDPQSQPVLLQHAILASSPAGAAATRNSSGYILKIFRIPNGDPQSQPVLLQHAILASSVNFLIIGNHSLGFILANEGYDVWLGNFRGTRYFQQAQISEAPDIPTGTNTSKNPIKSIGILASTNLGITT
ncbi:alpha/beta-hydrolase lipase region [Popillia japonica]